MTQERTPYSFNRAAYAVADAMMVAQAKQIGSTEHLKTVRDSDRIRMLAEHLQAQTANHCITGTVAAVGYLTIHNEELFDKLILIEGSGNFTHPNGYQSHIGFIARASQPDGTYEYYYGSPANHEAGKKGQDSTLSRILRARSLEELLKQINAYETGGEWPFLDDLSSFIEKSTLPALEVRSDIEEGKIVPILALVFDSLKAYQGKCYPGFRDSEFYSSL